MPEETLYTLPPTEPTLTEEDVRAIVASYFTNFTGSQGVLRAGTGNNVLKLDTNGFYIGNSTFGSAPLRVTFGGAITATSATITGSVTATSGTIGGFTIGASTISATNLTLTSGAANTARIEIGTGANLAGMNSGNAAGDIAFWAGATFVNRATAPFRVEMDGSIISTDGTIGGFTIASTTLSATNLTLTSGATNTANITVGTGATAAGLNSANVAGDIAIWAGSTFANRATAPFRVEADGSVITSDITITGGSMTGGTIGAAPTINGTRADIVQPRAETLFKRFTFVGSKDDGFTESVRGGTGTITRDYHLSRLDTGSAGTAIYGSFFGVATRSEANWDRNWEFIVYLKLDSTDTDYNVFIGILDNAAGINENPSTERHFGFHFNNTTVEGSNGNGTTETNTTITGITTSNWNTYRCVYTATSSIQFFVNDVLQGTSTTNIPSGTGTSANFIINNKDNSGQDRSLYVANGYVVIMTQP